MNVDKYSYDYKLFQDLETGELSVKSVKEKDGSYCENFDWMKIFTGLDDAFEEEIKKAKRAPGMYEMKYDGRVEYRSLPSNVCLDKLEEVLNSLV